jgi:hypothetical protein
VELTNINNLPTNAAIKDAFRQQWGFPLYEDRFLYFLNDNFNPKHREEDGWWTRGDRTCDFILRTWFPVREVTFKLLNNPRLENAITVTVEGKTQRIILGPNQRGTLRFAVGNGFQVLESHMYRVKVKAAKGAMPYYENEKSDEKRWLGVFFGLDLVAAPAK